jgi:DNA-binding IclR family transcriptional regulator
MRSIYEPEGPLAPAVADAMAILNLLATRAPARPGLSEIARALGISKASCYRILQTLQAGRYVVQHPRDKTYALGPALIDLGEAAAGDAHLLELAREATTALAERTRFHVGATKLTEDSHLTMIAQARSGRPLHLSFALRQRRLPRPPLGTTFFAWAPPAEVERWLDMASVTGAPLTSSERAAYHEQLRAVRRRGYHYVIAVSARTDAGRIELESWLQRATAIGLESQPADAPARGPGPDVRTDDDVSLPVPLVTIAAPVFDHHGRVVLNLAITDFSTEIPPERVRALGKEVRESADAITAGIGGSAPPADVAPEELAGVQPAV